MNNMEVQMPDTLEKVKLCPAAVGASTIAGTTDGPGPSFVLSLLGISQGTTSGSNFLADAIGYVARFIVGMASFSFMTTEEVRCHEPKAVLLPLPSLRSYEYPVQVFRIGQLHLLNAPVEITTVAGHRLRAHVHDVLKQMQPRNEMPPANENQDMVVINGFSNDYASYLTTFEEYQAQRYEASQTLHGPHSLRGWMQAFGRVVRDFNEQSTPVVDDAGEAGWDFFDSYSLTDIFELVSGVLFILDKVPSFSMNPFGGFFSSQGPWSRWLPIVQVTELGTGADCTFELVVAFPEENMPTSIEQDHTYLQIKHFNGSDWVTTHSDASPDTFLQWKDNTLEATWLVFSSPLPGSYMFCYSPSSKSKSIYSICSKEFAAPICTL
jgi:hypothetical protein